MKNLKNDLQTLVKQGVIDNVTAERIKAHYDQQQTDSGNRILMVFGVLAACLIGLGVILIIGHNWDNLPIALKTGLAFLPLTIAQGLCFYAMSRKEDSAVWRETCSTLLFFGIGACMAMISQIYNLKGDLSGFFLTWMILSLPVVYLMSSKVVSMFYLIGLTQSIPYVRHGCEWVLESGLNPWAYMTLFSMVIPFYVHYIKNNPRRHFTTFYHWVVAITGLIILMKNDTAHDLALSISFMLIVGIYYGIGQLQFFRNNRLWNTPFAVIGSVGMIGTLFLGSFEDFWKLYGAMDIDQYKMVLLAIAAVGILIWNILRKNINARSILPYTFIIYCILIFFQVKGGFILMNLILLAIALEYLYKGHKVHRLSYFNYGLAIISITTIARFFEWDLSFVLRGVCFVVLGIIFLLANYYIVKRRKHVE